MSKQVIFGMYWQVYGRQTIDLPDDVDATDLEAVKEYIKSVWANVGIPVGEYVGESDEFDEESVIEVTDDGVPTSETPHMRRCPICHEVIALTMENERGYTSYKCPACGGISLADRWEKEASV